MMSSSVEKDSCFFCLEPLICQDKWEVSLMWVYKRLKIDRKVSEVKGCEKCLEIYSKFVEIAEWLEVAEMGMNYYLDLIRKQMEGRTQDKENDMREEIIRKCLEVKKRCVPKVIVQRLNEENIKSRDVTTPIVPPSLLESSSFLETEAEPVLEELVKHEPIPLEIGFDSVTTSEEETEDHPLLDPLAMDMDDADLDVEGESPAQLPQQSLPDLTFPEELMPLVSPAPASQHGQKMQLHNLANQAKILYKCHKCQLFFPSEEKILEHLATAVAHSKSTFAVMQKQANCSSSGTTSSDYGLGKSVLEKQKKKENPSKKKNKEHMELEKLRRRSLSSQLKSLQGLLPKLQNNIRFSKRSILNEAISLIKSLEKRGLKLEDEETLLTNRNTFLKAKQKNLMSSIPESQINRIPWLETATQPNQVFNHYLRDPKSK